MGKKTTDLVLYNARLFDPSSKLDEMGGLAINFGKIIELGKKVTSKTPAKKHIDCEGLVLCPGLVDMRVFTGEPGEEHRETLKTASDAAAAGGVTTLICMPNTDPVIDDVSLVDFVERRARDTGNINIHTMAALTKGLEGKELTEIGLLKEAGAVAFTDGVKAISHAQIMRRALLYARGFDALIVQHVEDPSLSGGDMNSGEIASRLGLSGIPSEAETILLERDLRLVEMTQARYHAAQMSSAQGLEALQTAKKRSKHLNNNVSAGVSINNLVLNENDIGAYRTFFKLSPPLRSESDRQALIRGLNDGLIDVIVSDHNPQDPDTKRRPFTEAAFGAVGVETLLPAALSLYHSEDVSLERLITAMTSRPAELLGLKCGKLIEGAPADLALIHLDMPWVIDVEDLKSKSKNSSFEGRRLQGAALRTFVAGKQVYKHPRLES